MFNCTYPCYCKDENERYNIDKVRTIRNTYVRSYNCYGYAFGTFLWEDFDDFGLNMSLAKEKDDYLEELSDLVSTTFPDYCRISAEELPLYKKKTVIAMRLSDDDFHFRVRKRNGIWYEKCGMFPIRRCPQYPLTTDESETWDFMFESYDSKIIYFINQKEV